MPHLIFFDQIRLDTKWKLYLCRATKNNRVAEFVLPLVFKTRNLSEKCENIAMFCLQQYFVIGFVQKSSVQICLTIKSAFKKWGKDFFGSTWTNAVPKICTNWINTRPLHQMLRGDDLATKNKVVFVLNTQTSFLPVLQIHIRLSLHCLYSFKF